MSASDLTQLASASERATGKGHDGAPPDALRTDAPEADAPETDAPESDVQERAASDSESPQFESPDSESPDFEIPESAPAEAEAVEDGAPQTDVLEVEPSELEASAGEQPVDAGGADAGLNDISPEIVSSEPQAEPELSHEPASAIESEPELEPAPQAEPVAEAAPPEPALQEPAPPEPSPPEPSFETVGMELAAARLARGLTPEDIEAAVLVKAEYVEAIEAGDHRRMPGGPYGVGFVRTYARYLGLDDEAIARRYRAETAPKTDAPRLTPSDEPPTPIELPWRAIAGAAGGVIAVALVWWGVQPRQSDSVQMAPPVPETLREWALEPPGVADLGDLVRADGPTITLVAKVDTRITVRAPDGDIVYDAPLARGQLYETPMFEGLTVAAPNAGAVEARRDGEVIGRLGASGVPASAWSIDAARLAAPAPVPAVPDTRTPDTRTPDTRTPAPSVSVTRPTPRSTASVEAAPVTAVANPSSGPISGPRSAPAATANAAPAATPAPDALASILSPEAAEAAARAAAQDVFTPSANALPESRILGPAPSRFEDLPPIAPVSTTPPATAGDVTDAAPDRGAGVDPALLALDPFAAPRGGPASGPPSE